MFPNFRNSKRSLDSTRNDNDARARRLSIRSTTLRTSLGGELELLARNSAQLEKPNQSFLDQVVRTRGAGGDADNGGARRKPEVGNHFAFFGQIVMLDFIAREKPRSVQDKIGRQFFLAHFREVRSVRAVVTANNKEQIHFDVE